MSQRIHTALRPATQCTYHSTRRYAPRGYLFLRDDPHTSPSYRHRPRPFSTSPRCAGVSVRQVKASQQQQPAQPSMHVQRLAAANKAMRSGQLPEDLGLLPETFIMPFGKQRPSWWSNWRQRLKLERVRWVQRGKDVVLYLVFWRQIHRPSPHPWKLSNIAKELHREMFANFAAGDMQGTGKNLCTGILNSLQRRIEQRPPNTSYLWKLHKYLSPPALVSYKVHAFPETLKWPKKERHGVAQAIVRIHSLQSLRPLKRVRVNERDRTVYKEMVVDSQGNEHLRERMTESTDVRSAKETVEYVVIQQMYKMAEPGEWKVWGTTEETTLDKVEALQARRAKAKKRNSVEKALAGEGEKEKAVS